MLKRSVALIISLFISSNAWARPEVIPVVNALFTTGQWYFDGDRSNMGGNAHLNVVPALKFSDSFSIIPSVETKYRGTASAEDLAGGNTFFQDSWENGANIKFVHKLGNNWKLREHVAGQIKWYRETTDESFSNGLYDYQNLNLGAEIERSWGKKVAVALSYDISELTFPNYKSLESGQSSDLAREFAGDDVLDSDIQLATMRSRFPLPLNVGVQLNGFFSPRDYTDQHIVELSGLLTATKRTDTIAGGTVSLDRMFKTPKRTRLLTTGFFSYTGLDSNQNHYDARVTTFISDFYDYDQHQVGGSLALAFGSNKLGPSVVEVGTSFTRRNYRSRVIQDANGSYQTEKLYVNENALNISYSYPVARFFRLNVSSNFNRSKSNNNYEELYRYNFNGANYQFGFIYEY